MSNRNPVSAKDLFHHEPRVALPIQPGARDNELALGSNAHEHGAYQPRPRPLSNNPGALRTQVDGKQAGKANTSQQVFVDQVQLVVFRTQGCCEHGLRLGAGQSQAAPYGLVDVKSPQPLRSRAVTPKAPDDVQAAFGRAQHGFESRSGLRSSELLSLGRGRAPLNESGANGNQATVLGSGHDSNRGPVL